MVYYKNVTVNFNNKLLRMKKVIDIIATISEKSVS